MVWVGLRHINACTLFNAKSFIYIYIYIYIYIEREREMISKRKIYSKIIFKGAMVLLFAQS